MIIGGIDWRGEVKFWKVESFFGKWIVRPDDSDVYCYKAKWRWLAVRAARRFAKQHGGGVVIK